MTAPLSRPVCGISLGLDVYQIVFLKMAFAHGLFFFMTRLCHLVIPLDLGLALAFWNLGSHGARREGVPVGTYLFSNQRCDLVDALLVL
jgi:hypothetical protein